MVENANKPLTGKRALITGGASGIGLAIAEKFSELGATPIIADLDGAAADRIAERLNGESWVVDLSKTSELENLDLDVDILVNNAGIQRVSAIPDFDPEAYRLIQRIMLEAPFLLIRAVLPGMYAKKWGRIINISSVHGIRASAFKSAYVAAKHGLEGLSKVTALEGAEHGVTSNCINPGYVRTPLVDKQIADQAKLHGIDESEVIAKIMLTESAVKRLAEPREVASLAAWIASDDAALATGSDFVLDGGWSAH